MNKQLAGITNINAFILNALKMALQTQEKQNDPLLSLSGILSYQKNDISEKHDEYIGQAVKND
jgi:hypothetical protein